MPSLNFEEAFSHRVAASKMQCGCGRYHFDAVGSWDWDDGELENLEQLSDTSDEYVRHSHSVEATFVDGGGICVIDCPCGRHDEFERLMLRNEEAIIHYFELCRQDVQDRLQTLDKVKDLQSHE